MVNGTKLVGKTMAGLRLIPLDEAPATQTAQPKLRLIPLEEPTTVEPTYKFSDPLSAAPEYIPSKEERAAEYKPPAQLRGPMRSELTQEEQAYRREQAPFQRVMELANPQPLRGPIANVPLPPTRPPEFRSKPVLKEQPPIFINPLLGAGESPIGKVRGAVNPETGETYYTENP